MKYPPHFLTNPFTIYAMSWIIIIILYNLKWTYLYPSLSLELFSFFILTSSFALLIAYITTKKNLFVFIPIEVSNKRLSFLKKILKILYICLILELLYCRQIPIVAIFQGGNSSSYLEFGLPFIHVFIVTGFIFLFTHATHCRLSTKDPDKRKILLKIILYCLLCGVIIVNRAIIMYSLAIAFYIYLIAQNKIIKSLMRIILPVILIFYLFGAIGNIRNTASFDAGKEYIMEVGDATPKFRESIFPAEFFWPYLYMTSPLSNVEYTIQNKEIEYTIENFLKYCFGCLMPQMISKRLGFIYNSGELVQDNLNVGSVYSGAYSNFGWIGMWLTFLFMFFFVFVNIRIIPKSSPYYVSTIAILSIIILFNVFDNMFIFSGLVPALCYPILFSIKRKNCNCK